MTIYDARHGARGRVIDGHGSEVKDVVRIDTETGEALQYVRDAHGQLVVCYEPPGSDFEQIEMAPDANGRLRPRPVRRTAVVETREIVIARPVRVEPLKHSA